jgi:nucleotide-binding universal stress UspA family protein
MHEGYPADMGRIIQIRDVDDADYAVLRARAEAEGVSLTTYLKRELHRLAGSPTMAELLDRADRRKSRGGYADSAAIASAISASRGDLEER